MTIFGVNCPFISPTYKIATQEFKRQNKFMDNMFSSNSSRPKQVCTKQNYDFVKIAHFLK